MTDDYSPADALASIQGQRDKLAEQAASPPGYHVMLALVIGALIASPFFQSFWILGAVYVGCGLATYGLVRYYKHYKGMWVSGNSDRAAKKYAAAAGMITGFGFAASVALEFSADIHGPSLALAVIAVPVVTWLGYKWDAAYEKELRAAA